MASSIFTNYFGLLMCVCVRARVCPSFINLSLYESIYSIYYSILSVNVFHFLKLRAALIRFINFNTFCPFLSIRINISADSCSSACMYIGTCLQICRARRRLTPA